MPKTGQNWAKLVKIEPKCTNKWVKWLKITKMDENRSEWVQISSKYVKNGPKMVKTSCSVTVIQISRDQSWHY